MEDGRTPPAILALERAKLDAQPEVPFTLESIRVLVPGALYCASSNAQNITAFVQSLLSSRSLFDIEMRTLFFDAFTVPRLRRYCSTRRLRVSCL